MKSRISLWFITMCRVFVTYKFFFRWNCQIDRFRLWKHIKISTIPILVICISYDSCTMSIIWIELWHLECGIPDLYNELTYNWCAIFCYFAMFSFYGFCRLSYFFLLQNNNNNKKLYQMHIHNWYRLKNVNWLGRSESARTICIVHMHKHSHIYVYMHQKEHSLPEAHWSFKQFSLVVFVSSALFFRLFCWCVFFFTSFFAFVSMTELQ